MEEMHDGDKEAVFCKAMPEESAVTLIPASERSVQQLHAQRKLRVAAYCRVSTGDESQQTSYTKQKEFYTAYIESKEGWQLAGIYADEAISGTSRAKRAQFNQMMEDAVHGKMDYIITKSISRFARNTVDTLECVRQLAQLDPAVGIFFEKENIDTLDAKGELVLTILSALAQDESRSISENIRWTFQKKFAEGKPQINLARMIGYDMGEDSAWVINPEQAAVVRYIFEAFLAGRSGGQIAAALNEMGKTTVNHKQWRASSVYTVLRNEKYVGDLEMQKYITKDFLTHKTQKNCGEAPRYYVKNHHIGIIDRDTWDKTQAILLGRRQQESAQKNGQAPVQTAGSFRNLICGACESRMERFRYSAYARGYRDVRCIDAENGKRDRDGRPLLKAEDYTERYSFGYAVFRCSAKYGKRGKMGRLSAAERSMFEQRCASPVLNETALEQGFMELLYRLKFAYEKDGDDCALMTEFQEAYQREYADGGELGNADVLARNMELFLKCLDALPFRNAAGDLLCIYGIHRGTYDLLKFEKGIYTAFVLDGVVNGEDVKLRTTFGVPLVLHTEGRTLSSFVGYRRCDKNGNSEIIAYPYQVSCRSIQYIRKKRGKKD